MKEVWFLRNKATRGFNSKREEIRFRLWKYVGNILFGCILDPLNFIRIWLLRVFGAKIGKNCYVSRKVGIVLPWLLEVGNDSGIDEYAYINGKVTIGDNVSIASFVKVVSAGHDVRSRYFDWKVSHRIIEDGVFVGANTFILGGGKVGCFTVVGANSFVCKDLPENSIAIGSPVRVHSERISYDEYVKYRYNA